VEALKSQGAKPIEVDTDGVYFVPAPDVETHDEEVALIRRVGESLPGGVRLTHDGRYRAMLSLQLKNYALLSDDGSLTMKGSSLRSRRLELVFRRFIADAARWFMLDDRAAVRERYFELARQIKHRQLDSAAIGQWVMDNEETLDSQPRLRTLIDRLPQSRQSGDRLQIYEREDGELALLSDYAADESRGYLLRRLHETSGRFRPLFETETDFLTFFPPLSARTDLESAQEQEASTQLPLF
jgi:DNA polymerase elongation subunit (family B)